jgi:hypothetical protein
MKTLIATAILIASVSATAHAHSIQNNNCNVELNAGIHINNEFIEFSRNDKVLYTIEGQSNLIVNNENVYLSKEQENLIAKYSNSIRDVIPEAKGLAIEGIAMASEGVNLAFDELLGQGNEISEELTIQLNSISAEIQDKFSIEKGIKFDENGMIAGDFFDKEFEQRLESTIENAVKNSMGSLMIAVGQEMLFSGGNMDAFETRMENFGQQIEHEMENRSEAIEQRANNLCRSIQAIDDIESQMQQTIEILSDINILTVNTSEHNEI